MNDPPPETEPIRPLVEELTPAPDPWEVCLRLSSPPSSPVPRQRRPPPRLGPLFVRDGRIRSAGLRRVGGDIGTPKVALDERPPSPRWPGGWRPTAPNRFPACRRFRAERRGCSATTCAITSSGCRGPGATTSRRRTWPIGFYDWVVAFDHAQRRGWIISTGFPERDPARRNRRAAERLSGVRRLLTGTAAVPPSWRVGLPVGTIDPGRLYPLPGLKASPATSTEPAT